MGYKYDATNVPTDEERIAEALSEIECELDHVRGDPARREPTDPGILTLLEDCVSSEYWGLALSIAFALGRASIVGYVDPAAAARAIDELKAQRRVGEDRGRKVSDEADDKWRREAEKIWRERYANVAPDDPRRIRVEDLVSTIQNDVAGAADLESDTIKKQISEWNARDGIKPIVRRRSRR